MRAASPTAARCCATTFRCWWITACGYHTILSDAPRRCWLPPALAAGGRTWGISAQLYTVQRPGNWGMATSPICGRWSMLRLTARSSALTRCTRGPDQAGGQASPIPLQPAFLNPLYIDVEAIEEFGHCAEGAATARPAGRRIAVCRGGAQRDVSRPGNMRITWRCWRGLYLLLVRARGGNGAAAGRQREFEQFRAEHGERCAGTRCLRRERGVQGPALEQLGRKASATRLHLRSPRLPRPMPTIELILQRADARRCQRRGRCSAGCPSASTAIWRWVPISGTGGACLVRPR